MIYDLDIIDFSRHDRLKRTIYMTIYDTIIEDIDPQKHKQYLDNKIELYVNYIIDREMSKYFSISDEKEKKYKYIIQLILDFVPEQQYLDYIKVIDSQVLEYTSGHVRVTW